MWNRGHIVGGGAYDIPYSGRFDGSSYLSRTPSASNRKTWTASFWLKRSATGSGYFFSAGTNYSSDFTSVAFTSSDQLMYQHQDAGANTDQVISTAVFRDISAWYHIVVAVDTTEGTASDRVKMWVNGAQLTSFGTANYPTASFDTDVNAAVEHRIGSGASNFNGLMAEVHFLDGTAATPSDFGETDAATGRWVPKEYTGGAYGTNGSHPDFSDAGEFGQDSKGIENWLLYSQQLDDGTWSKLAGTTITANAAANPRNGTVDADQIEMPGAGGSEGVQQIAVTGSPADETWTFSFWAKADSARDIRVRLDSTSSGSLSTLSLTTDWQQFSVSRTFGGSDVANVEVNIFNAGTPSSVAFVVDSCQLEPGTLIRDYQETTVSVASENSFSSTGFATTDQLIDTPTRNFATWNALALMTSGSNKASLSEGGLKASASGTDFNGVLGTFAPRTGKWGFEVTITAKVSAAAPAVGIAQTYYSPFSATTATAYTQFKAFTYAPDATMRDDAGSSSSYGATFTTADVIEVLMDLDVGTLVMKKNGSSQGTLTSSLTVGARYSPFVYMASSGDIVDIDCGQGGYVPSDSSYKPLSFSDLPEPFLKNAQSAFVTATDTETNVAATLAAARSGWSDYVDVLKNLSNIETWAWRFSHDSSNEHALSTTGTYQAARALSGADTWQGMSIRIGSTYGTAAGSAVHTNGVATTVTHNLGTARCFIALFNRSNGEVYCYHPDLTSGSLIVLTDSATETASTVITNITANAFDIGSGVASATFDYLVLSEQDGLCDLFSFSANASTDGPFIATGHEPAFLLMFTKGGSAAGRWTMQNAINTYNPWGILTDSVTQMNTDAAGFEGTSYQLSTKANGLKVETASDFNTSGRTIVGVSIAKATFKYARAA